MQWEKKNHNSLAISWHYRKKLDKNGVLLESKLPQLHVSKFSYIIHVMIQPKRAEIVDILMINFPLLSSHSFFTLSQCYTRNHKHYTPNENAMQTPNGTIIIKCVKSPPNIYINRFAYQQVFCCKYKLLFQLYGTSIYSITHTHTVRTVSVIYYILSTIVPMI